MPSRRPTAAPPERPVCAIRYNALVTDAFGAVAEPYDRWYESVEGAAVFAAEVACLRVAAPQIKGDWLEIGVGTGRFAVGLGVSMGVDASLPMLTIAARRGVRAIAGNGENLPCPERSLDGILMVATLCFVEDAPRVLHECARVLRPGGALLIGHIPADGPWGQSYLQKAREGHPLYSHARFGTAEELRHSASTAGLTLKGAASTLFWPPGGTPERPPRIARGISAGAGFIGLRFTVSRTGTLRAAPPTHKE